MKASGVTALIARVAVLFREQEQLRKGFNQFLPEGMVLPVPSGGGGGGGGGGTLAAAPRVNLFALQAEVGEDPDIRAATSYVARVRARFAHESGATSRYRTFLKVLNDYQRAGTVGGRLKMRNVVEQVCSLFRGHTDLLADFAHFVPDAERETARQHLQRAVAEAEAEAPARKRGEAQAAAEGAPEQELGENAVPAEAPAEAGAAAGGGGDASAPPDSEQPAAETVEQDKGLAEKKENAATAASVEAGAAAGGGGGGGTTLPDGVQPAS